MAWSFDPGYPRKLPDLTQKPRRYSTESDNTYTQRCWKWRVWLDAEPRPDQWYATDKEVTEYRGWRDQ